MLKTKDTGCYNINVTFILSQKDGFLKFAKFEFRYLPSLSSILKKGDKVFGKIPWRFDIILLMTSLVLFFITYDNYDQYH